MRVNNKYLKAAISYCRWRTLRVKASLIALFDELDGIVAYSATVPGWVSGDAAREMAGVSNALNDDATIVEVGVFMGRSTALLAGPRRLQGSGKVHCVDAFDCSGDAVSVPFYVNEVATTGLGSMEQAFRQNMSRLRLSEVVEVHKGSSQEVAAHWVRPIDLLLLDGDHSPQGARASFEEWLPHLKIGGVLILHNTGDREYTPGHDGNRRLTLTEVTPPKFSAIRTIDNTTFAVRAA
jgi:hypothetical protein